MSVTPEAVEVWTIRCGFVTNGSGVLPDEEQPTSESWGPFFFSEEAAEQELAHLKAMCYEDSFEVQQTTVGEISSHQTESPELWKSALVNYFSRNVPHIFD